MRVIISAYNCSPYKGSEDALGWNSAYATATANYEVIVITRDVIRKEIYEYINNNKEDTILNRMTFKFIKTPNSLKNFKNHVAQLIKYRIFQRRVIKVVKNIEKSKKVDYIHHVSWASMMRKLFLYKAKSPVILGPVGGGESTPSVMLKNFTKINQLKEIIRKTLAQISVRSRWFDKVCKKSSVIFVTTEESYNIIPDKYQKKTFIMQGIGVRDDEILHLPAKRANNAFKVIMVGRLIYWKGIDLGIKAVSKLVKKGLNIELHIYGDGKEINKLINLSSDMIDSNIFFHGNISRNKLLNEYNTSSVLLNTSLHDSGCMVILEAMSKGVPIIHLDVGGPKTLTTESCAIKIPVNEPQFTVNEISNSIEKLYINRQALFKMGANAIERVQNNFEYSRKFFLMEKIIKKHL
ncbi:MAG: glycosyltransferase family 4 protein [bacterium]